MKLLKKLNCLMLIAFYMIIGLRILKSIDLGNGAQIGAGICAIAVALFGMFYTWSVMDEINNEQN